MRYPCYVCGDLIEARFPVMWSNNESKGGCRECGRDFTHEWAALRAVVVKIEEEKKDR